MTRRSRDFLAVARAAARCCSDKKADDIKLFDVRRTSGLADYYLLASVDSSTQLQAVQDHIDRRLKQEFDVDPLHRDGVSSPHWAVLDYGGTVVHVMHRAAREFYGLERLWERARPVEWEKSSPPARRKTARPRKDRRKRGSRRP